MTGFQSQAGHVGVRTQAAKGAYLNPGAAGTPTGVFLRTKSGAMGGNRELMVPDAEIGGGRDVSDALLGPVGFKGSYDYYARMESIATFLYGLCGTKSVSGPVTGVYSHVITPTDSELPWLSVEERIGDGYQAFKYTDCKVSSFHLEAEANGYLMSTVELIGLSQVSVGPSFTALADRRYDTTPLMVGTNVIVEFNGVKLPAKSFKLDINNNLEDNDFRLGSLFLGDLVEKRREFTIGVTVRPEDGALWRQAMYGAAGRASAGGTVTKGTVHVRCETYDVIPGGGAEFYSLDIAIPSGVIAPFAVNPSGDDILQHDLEIRCLRPNPAVPVLTATIKNGSSYIA